MATMRDRGEAERDVRRLLESQGLPAPDEVEHRESEIVLLWHESKLALVIDLDEPPD